MQRKRTACGVPVVFVPCYDVLTKILRHCSVEAADALLSGPGWAVPGRRYEKDPEKSFVRQTVAARSKVVSHKAAALRRVPPDAPDDAGNAG